jgi:glycosyltransferase involved in cell wall biosynthesis
VDEPFGNTAVEAVLAARPVVVSATSGLREAAAGYASAQYVTPGDPRALADAVLAVRDRWPEFRDAAVADAGAAARRHSPEGYRGQVAELLGALTATR